jgi:hypothetical protein
MIVPRFTPGRFTALWVILRSAAKLGENTSAEELLSFARRGGLRSGGLPIKDGFELAMLGGFIEGTEHVTLTHLGHLALQRGIEEEPSSEVLRLFTSVLLLRHPPAWVAYWQGDPSSLDLVLPDPSRQLLEDAGVLNKIGTDDLEAWALWDALKATPPAEITAQQRKAIGDTAEELTFLHEKQRLTREGHPSLAARVRWVARESPAYGFDILSFFGSFKNPDAPHRPLAIEVKGHAVAGAREFKFFLTSHEWETALALKDQYLIHLWDGVRPGATAAATRTEPLLLFPHSLTGHIPRRPPCDDVCSWNSTVIKLLTNRGLDDPLH